MGIFQKISSLFSAKSASVPLLSPTFGRSFFGISNNRSGGDYYKGWVYGCVVKIKDQIAAADYQLKKLNKQGKVEIIQKHPALTVLKKVNDYFTQYKLFERLGADMELMGNHYWLVVKNKQGVPIELYPLFSSSIRAVSDPEKYVAYYEYTMDGKTYHIPPELIIHFQNYNPNSFTVGLSTIEAARMPVDTDDATKAFNRQFFEGNAMPGVILEYPTTLNADAQKQMRDQWDEQFKGFKKAYRTAVAAGGLKIHQTDVKQADMQFIEQRKFNRDEICALFGVPPEIMGITEVTTYASVKAAEVHFTKFTIEPKLTRIDDTLNEFFLKFFPDAEDMYFEHVSTVPTDITEKTLYYQTGINNGFLSPNDIRRMEGLPELKDGEYVYMPGGLIPISKPSVKELVEVPVTKSVAFAHKEGWIEGIVTELMKTIDVEQEEIKEIAGKWTSKEFDQIGEKKISERNPRTVRYEKVLESATQKLFVDQKKRVLAKMTEENIKSYRTKFKVESIFDEEVEVDITVDLFTPLFGVLTEEEGKQALEAIGLDPEEFSIDTPTMQEYLRTHTQRFAGGITQTTSDGIRSTISEGLEAGEAIVDIKKRIEEFSGFESARAVMIARTETIRAQGEADLVAWKESGVVSSTVWYTALDERTCPECEPMHGVEVATGDEFLSQSDLEDRGISVYDGGVDAPPLHPQCRCTLIPVVK